MTGIGIDVGSNFTKYCAINDGAVSELRTEKTPVRQREYFEAKAKEFEERYPGAKLTSCGYGRQNVGAIEKVNELAALAKGAFFVFGDDCDILDIGGQDTKVLSQTSGRLRDFFINDKCAAGSGMFLNSALEMVGVPFEDIDLTHASGTRGGLSAACAVFAQSDIVKMIADNKSEQEIIQDVLFQILIKAKPLVNKLSGKDNKLMLTGGLSKIKGLEDFASGILDKECRPLKDGAYLAALGCALISAG